MRWLLNRKKKYTLSGWDGPYIFGNGSLKRVIRVEKSGKDFLLKEKEIKIDAKTIFSCRVDNEEKDQFTFQLRSAYEPPPITYDMPEKMLAVSDIEGNFQAFHSLLLVHGVIDEKMNWAFGKGHLAIVGDLVDRGRNVTQLLWLIYKLEQQAATQGGHVHALLGNHEAMNFQHNTAYVHSKYIALARQLSGLSDDPQAFAYLMKPDSELVRWLASRNTIERVGDILLVHGGISPEMLELGLSMEEINHLSRQALWEDPRKPAPIESQISIVAGNSGPLWYRGLVMERFLQRPPQGFVDAVLDYFGAKKMVIGHSMVKDISSDYKGKVYRIDVEQPNKKFTGNARALWIEHGLFFKVNDTNMKEQI